MSEHQVRDCIFKKCINCEQNDLGHTTSSKDAKYMSCASFMSWLALELGEKLRKVTFHSNCSFSTLFLLYILIWLFCRAQQSRLSSPWAAEVLPCLLLAWRFSRPLSGQHPAGNSSCVPSFVLCPLVQSRDSRGAGEGKAVCSAAWSEWSARIMVVSPTVLFLVEEFTF